MSFDVEREMSQVREDLKRERQRKRAELVGKIVGNILYSVMAGTFVYSVMRLTDAVTSRRTEKPSMETYVHEDGRYEVLPATNSYDHDNVAKDIAESGCREAIERGADTCVLSVLLPNGHYYTAYVGGYFAAESLAQHGAETLHRIGSSSMTSHHMVRDDADGGSTEKVGAP